MSNNSLLTIIDLSGLKSGNEISLKYIEDLKKDYISQNISNPKIKECLLYAVEGGKNLRIKIFLKMIDHFLAKTTKLITHSILTCLTKCSLFVEFIHISSLILDDCPHMDNDSSRRNKPSVHRKFSYALAQLSAFVLIEKSFRIIQESLEELTYEYNFYTEENLLTILRSIGKMRHDFLGENGLAGGQVYDLFILSSGSDQLKEGEEEKGGATLENYLKCLECKTSRLFEAAFSLPFLLTSFIEEDENLRENFFDKYINIGKAFGICFQIRDDWADFGTDEKGKNILDYVSMEKSREIYSQHLSSLKNTLKDEGIDQNFEDILSIF